MQFRIHDVSYFYKPFVLWHSLSFKLLEYLVYFLFAQILAHKSIVTYCLFHIFSFKDFQIMLVFGARLIIYSAIVKPIRDLLARRRERSSALAHGPTF